MELMAKKNLVDSGDLHEAFQKTDRSVFAGGHFTLSFLISLFDLLSGLEKEACTPPLPGQPSFCCLPY